MTGRDWQDKGLMNDWGRCWGERNVLSLRAQHGNLLKEQDCFVVPPRNGHPILK